MFFSYFLVCKFCQVGRSIVLLYNAIFLFNFYKAKVLNIVAQRPLKILFLLLSQKKSRINHRSALFCVSFLRQLIQLLFSKQAICMSFFLLQVNGWTSKGEFGQRKMDLNRRRSCKPQQTLQRFDACMRQNIKKHQEFTYTMMSQDDKSKTYGMIIHKLSRNYKGLLSFVYNKRTHMVSVLFNFLAKDDTFLRVQSKQILVQFYRTIILGPEAQQSFLKLMVDHYNGSLHLKIAYFSLSNSNLMQDLGHSIYMQSKNLILQIYKQYFQPLVPLFEKALELTIPIERRLATEEQPKLMGSLHRYLKMMTIGAYLNSETVISQEARERQLKKREENCKRLFTNQVLLEQAITKPAELFIEFNRTILDKKTAKPEFFISQMEQKSLISVIATDTSTPNDPNTSAHVLNFIKIHEPTKLEVRPLNFGGFSLLQSAQVNFWYVESFGDAASKDLNPANMVRKYMAIKKDNRPHGKTLHESKILMEMRHGVSNSLPKYFVPVNIPGSEIKVNPLLMMELFTDGNLVEYLRHRYHFLSLLTKLYLMFSITMALRFLETYKIVHLDLKPNNIMLAPGLMIKLIDFGEAFHPQVCRDPHHRYRPGFTLPYSPPEFRYGLKYGFTSKSDVFSLGILMFEILYGRVPFETRQKLFLAAQGCDLYGDPVLIRILNWVISRCLSKNPDLRPELDWIAIILRLCLELVVT